QKLLQRRRIPTNMIGFRSNRTLLRDVEALVRRGLLSSGPDGVRANRERIRAFLPWRNEPPS
ncbi:MAG: hypothetical protein OXG99_16645, partial [Alphaproteobacteria bacterium]|nr:hypothetical protein [Alphaproteobacteria bacterium]